MAYTIRDEKGNMLFSIENVNPDVSFESINNELDNINKESNMLAKSIESFNIISDAKAMEAFGYVKGAGFKENVKAVSKEIWKKIQEFFNTILEYLKRFGKWIAGIFKKDKNDKTSSKTVDKVKNDHKNEKINDYIHDPDVIKRADNIVVKKPRMDIIEISENIKNAILNKNMSEINESIEIIETINKSKNNNNLSENKIREVISKEIKDMNYSEKIDQLKDKIEKLENILNDINENFIIKMIKETNVIDESIHNASINLCKQYSNLLVVEINELTIELRFINSTKKINEYVNNGINFDPNEALSWIESNYHHDFKSPQHGFKNGKAEAMLKFCESDPSVNNRIQYIYDTITVYSAKSFNERLFYIPRDIPYNSFIYLLYSDYLFPAALHETMKRTIVNDVLSILIPGFLHRINRSLLNYMEVSNELDDLYGANNKFEIFNFKNSSNIKFDPNKMIGLNNPTSDVMKDMVLVGFKQTYSGIKKAIVFTDNDEVSCGQKDSEHRKFWKIAEKKYMD